MPTYNETLHEYILDVFVHEDESLRHARESSVQKGLPAISVAPDEGRFLQFLVRACGASRAVEIGTLGGYSGIWIARGLLPGGKLYSLEKDAHHAEVARNHIAGAKVDHIIEIITGDARESLQSLAAQAPFDFVFIDATKTEYNQYFDWALQNVRVGGVIAAHNAFRAGKISDPSDHDESTVAMRLFSQRVAAEPGVISTVFPAGDGMVLAVKLPPP